MNELARARVVDFASEIVDRDVDSIRLVVDTVRRLAASVGEIDRVAGRFQPALDLAGARTFIFHEQDMHD